MKININTDYLKSYLDSSISSQDLRIIADKMDEDNIESICIDIDSGYYNISIEEVGYRKETPEEKAKRLAKENKEKEKVIYAQAKKKQRMIIEARKMGLTISDVDPIKSNYDHVYWVPKGTAIEDWVVDKDGYVWYDDAGLLGQREVYGTAKKANEALGKYIMMLELE